MHGGGSELVFPEDYLKAAGETLCLARVVGAGLTHSEIGLDTTTSACVFDLPPASFAATCMVAFSVHLVAT